MVATNLGPIGWELERDDNEGHRTYTIKHKVEGAVDDGPNTIINCLGLPSVGSTWSFGNDVDPWAFCTPYVKAVPLYQDKGTFWLVTHKFSTKPRDRCQDTNIENPLLEPQKVSGGFRKEKTKAKKDRFGTPIETTSFEEVDKEVDKSFPTVRVKQNVPLLELPNLAQYIDYVNSNWMWGVAPRKVKLTNVSWERNLYGSCFYYYTRDLEFELDWDTWDLKDIPNKGKKAKHGTYSTSGNWENEVIDGANPSSDNPDHYSLHLDRYGNPAETYLDSSGNPSSSRYLLPTKEYYQEANLLSIFNLPFTF